jgi:hypothetical protein
MGSASVEEGQGGQEVSSSLIRGVSRKLIQDRSFLRGRGSETLPEHAWFGRALTAVGRHLKLDHDAEWRTWETRSSEIIARLAEVLGMSERQGVGEIANHVPQVVVDLSRWHSPLTADEVVRKLWDGDPRIAILAEGQHGLRIMVWTRDSEHRVVADRIRLIFREAGGN